MEAAPTCPPAFLACPPHCLALPAGLSRADEDSPSKFAEALLGREFNSKSLQQFLQHGDEVLRFYMLWTSPEGTRFRFKLHFFVADSTVGVGWGWGWGWGCAVCPGPRRTLRSAFTLTPRRPSPRCPHRRR